MTSQQPERALDLGEGGPDRRVVAVGYLLTSLVSASVALLPVWPGVHDLPVLLIACLGLLTGAGLLLSPAWPMAGPRTAVVGTALGTSVAVYAADGSPGIGVLVALYSAAAAHIPFLRSGRAVLAATALPFALLPVALVASGHAHQVLGWVLVLPATTVVPVLGVRSLLRLAAHRARRDGGSDLLNRTGLLESCAQRLEREEDLGERVAVNVVHFDDLRDLRPVLGPAAAEEVLAECARRAAALPGSVVARIDLDSLAVVQPVELDASGEPVRTAVEEGRALRELLRAHVDLAADGPGQGLRVRPGVSVGVARAPEHGRDVEDLLALADVAAVRAGAEQHRVAVTGGGAAFDVDTLRLHAELPAAVEDGQLRVHYQRLVTAGTGRTVGVEALVRWQHPERGLLGPGAFVPLAERSQAIVGLTLWVLRTAAAQCGAWRAAGHDVGVSVNVSPVVLADPSLLDAVRRAVADNDLGRGTLTLEVTESALLADPAGVPAVLAALREAGARISLDDFGTGYTSLTMLRQFEVDELKIDQSFVAAAPKAPADAAIVRALVDLAHRLSLDVVAEGVEDARTADLVRSLGADVLQGFHFARPVPAEQVFTAPVEAPRDVPAAPAAPAAAVARAPRGGDEEERVGLARTVLGATARSEGLLRSVTALAAAVCGTEFASFNVVTEEHVHALAPHGHDRSLVPRDGTPCAWTAHQRDVLHLDPATDPRTLGGVAAGYGVRHYVGVPVTDAGGRVLGVLCAYDHHGTRPATALQRTQLQALAGVVADHLAGVDAAGQLARLHGLLQAMAELDGSRDPDRLLAGFGAAVHELLRPDFSFLVGPTTPLGERWDVLDHRGDVDPDVLGRVVFDAPGRSAVARSVATGRPVWVPDAATSTVVAGDLARRVGVGSVLTVPLVGPDGVVNVLSAVWRHPQRDLSPVLRDAAVAAATRVARQLAARPDRPAAPLEVVG
ncbi:EAL domain-containing protein (putative c-di-GMP-specific phosphodiesterase class I)/GGDEF domain-containing protein [Kineococcus radiotolerans]|uniref:EAL domain-containing protein (Putative c-di-GMP-specific phosphodiesterase class I)/GGDEF domain-containing protein n=1 Tax=Kineococcus radiotolerans TaxID=131568 RepID=A0A7W4TLH7_KINRA|nr:EAL domain-containing protein [Kineococcus radiotolerans]MBB2901133.1 EAL domain-containing protein (putative c-di-GMP-specific phosphodiesterase class I)/GGDEF domain-containing protein [Kineococcus radiotolerans]